jgi:hypothetical protein
LASFLSQHFQPGFLGQPAKFKVTVTPKTSAGISTEGSRMKKILPGRLNSGSGLLKSFLKASLIAMLLLFATERQAMAYTDPGTGALIWQALVGGFVGLLFYARRITAWFKKKKGPKD